MMITAANALARTVGMATPSTPNPKTKRSMAFPMTFKMSQTNIICIGRFALFIVRNIAAPEL